MRDSLGRMPKTSTTNVSHCPICGTALQLREVAPCMDCGARAQEIQEWRMGLHKYAEYRVVGLPLVLCDFCDADFPSYRPDYLGIPQPIADKDIEPVRPLPNA